MNAKLCSIISLLSIGLSQTVLFAQDKAPQPSPTGSLFSMLPMILLLFVVVYFLMIRPEQKKQKDRMNLLKNVKKGDKIVTIGGIFGTVGNVKDNSVMVKISENTVVEFSKSAIANIITDEAEKASTENKIDKENKK